MKTSTVSILAGVALALFGYIVLVERHQLTDIELEGRGGRLIERFSQRRVQSIVIERGGERIELVAMEREGDRGAEEERAWSMRAPVEARGDGAAVAALLGALEWAQPRRKFEGVSASELADYGLTEPAVRVTLRIAGETVTLSIGNRDTTEAGRYAVLDDATVVYVVGDDLFEAADHDAQHFRSRELFPDPLLDMSSMSVRRADSVTVLERDAAASDETWYLREPIAMLASAQRVRDIKRAVVMLEATRFIEGDVPLGDEFLRFESRAKTSDDGPMEPVLLRVGGPCGQHPGERYARAGERGPMACVRERDLEPLVRPASDLRELRPITLLDTDVEAFDLVVGRDTLHVEDDAGRWTYRLTRGGAAPLEGEVDPDAFAEWLGAIRSLETIDAEAFPEADLARRGFRAPRATLRMKGRGSAPDRTLTMGGSDMRGVFLRRDEELVALVVPAEVEARLAVSIVGFLPRRLLRERAEGLVQVRSEGEVQQTLERDGDGDFQLSAPLVGPADGAAARDLARRLATLEAARFVAEAAGPEHGLDSPRLDVRFRFEGALAGDAEVEDDGHGHGHGHAHEEPAGPSAPPRQHRLRIGNATEHGAFARLDERPEVFVLPTPVLELLSKPLVSTDLLRTSRNELVALRLERDGAPVELTHDGAFFVTSAGRVPEERMEPVLMAIERMRGESATFGVSFIPALSVQVTREDDAAEPRRYTLRVGPAGATHTPVQRSDLEVTFSVPNDQVAPLRSFQP